MCEISYLLKILDGAVAQLFTVKNKLRMEFIFLFAEFSGPLFRLRGPVCWFWLGTSPPPGEAVLRPFAHLSPDSLFTASAEASVQEGGGLLCPVHVVKIRAIFVCSHRGFLPEGSSPNLAVRPFSLGLGY